MPTIFTHAIAAVSLGRAGVPERRLPGWVWPLAGVCAMLPDADVIAFRLGVAPDSVFAHRGLSHSILFAFVLGGVVVRGVPALRAHPRWAAIWAVLSLATVSHGLLDALTNGGHGVAFFAPFSPARFFLPWRPILVSPIGFGFLSRYGVEVLLSEMTWVWAPCLAVLTIVLIARRQWRGSAQRGPELATRSADMEPQ